MSHRDHPAALPAERGFTILELVIAITIAVEILIGAGIAFDVHNRMARIQTQVTDMQQSLRIAQYDMARLVRMAGRGGLPADILPNAAFDPDDTPPILGGLAIEVRNNVGGDVNADPDRHIARGNEDSPQAVTGTDILIVRGCFANPLYQINSPTFDWDPDGNGVGDATTLTIPNPSLHSISQSLKPLLEEARSTEGDLTGLIAMQSPESRQTYGLGQVTGATFSGSDANDPSSVAIDLDLAAISPLNPVNNTAVPPTRMFPPRMTVALACLLEEYRYYVREEFEIPGDDTSEMRPRLARARFEPGTERPYHGDAENFRLDLADGIFDLQVALALDSDYPSPNPTGTPGSFDDDLDNVGVDDTIFEGPRGDARRAADDWLFNDPDDDPANLAWIQHRFPGNTSNPVDLLALRITTIARTARPDPSYESPDLDGDPAREIIEDNDYTEAPADYFRSALNRKYRHRTLTTVVELRNI